MAGASSEGPLEASRGRPSGRAKGGPSELSSEVAWAARRAAWSEAEWAAGSRAARSAALLAALSELGMAEASSGQAWAEAREILSQETIQTYGGSPGGYRVE